MKINEQILQLFESTFGKDYMTNPQLVKYVSKKDKHVIAYALSKPIDEPFLEINNDNIYEENYEIEGVSIFGSFTISEFDEIQPFPIQILFNKTPLNKDDFPISFFKCTTVNPDIRDGSIVGPRLCSYGMKHLLKNPPVIALARSNDSNAERLTRRYTNSELVKFINYTPPGYRCNICGIPCTCESKLYVHFTDERKGTMKDSVINCEKFHFGKN